MALSTELMADNGVWINPSSIAAMAVLLIAVVLLAAWLPARRAVRIEPTLALKA